MKNQPPSKNRPRARKPRTELRPLEFDTPRALRGGHPMAAWMNGGPGPLLRKLAVEGAGGEVTLTPDELARLVDEFRDDPLPENLRIAVTQQLCGKRIRRQGAPKKRQASRDQVELIMLPGAYAEALKDAEIERAQLRERGLKRGRYDDARKLPTASSIACALIRKRLPTLKDQSDRSILNLVSKIRQQLTDDNDDGSAPPNASSD